MDVDMMAGLIQHLGYAALFFVLCLGLISIPVPNEVIVMTAGAVSAGGSLLPLPAFLCTYLGVLSGLTFGYTMGRRYGRPLVRRFQHKERLGKALRFAESLLSRYGKFALCASYFFPLVRHVMPYLAGMNQMSFKLFAVFSYTTGLMWTLLYFLLGRLMGNQVQETGYAVYYYGMGALAVVVVGAAALGVVKWLSRARNQRDRTLGR
ncbi:DedA family protein [Paenibacillus sp. MWE-103]|uniref:DedA family protein n=1 Tax=Paenibacillus artemisiicola TaxID=1172618 RepID=A0ABS3W411_9BACL|nr:DedA family protein [Paenibacillus artemisiicola]MBO7742931.1 DedA family protein [Paenibacillus artemisiicola]